MPLPEGYLPREGDLVTMTGTVKWDVETADGRAHIKVDGSYTNIVVDLEHLGLARRRWNVGEFVTDVASYWPSPGKVIAVAGEFVWVENPGDGEPITIPANNLKEWRDPLDIAKLPDAPEPAIKPDEFRDF